MYLKCTNFQQESPFYTRDHRRNRHPHSHSCHRFLRECGSVWAPHTWPSRSVFSSWVEYPRPNGTIPILALKNRHFWKINSVSRIQCGLQSEPCCNRVRKLHRSTFTLYIRSRGTGTHLDGIVLYRSASTRIVASTWWFFTLIMVSSYTANLAAFLVIENLDSPIKSAEDLKDCGLEGHECPVTFGAKKEGSTINFFKVSTC